MENKIGLQHLQLPDTNDIDTAISQFVFSCEAAHLSPRTVETYQYQLGRFRQYCDLKRIRRVNDVSPDYIRGFQLFLRRDMQLSANSQKTTSTCLRTFLRWCIREGILDVDPAANVPKPRVPKVIQPAISDDDLVTILRSIDGRDIVSIRDRALIFTWLDTGLRLHEMASLRIGTFDFETGMGKVLGKGAKERFVFVSPTAQAHLREYLRVRQGVPADPLWLGMQGPLTKCGIRQIVEKIKDRSGVQFSSHDLRRTFAVLSLRNGADLLSISRQLGHADLSTTQLYLNQSKDDLKAVHDRSSPVEQLRLKTLR